MNKDEFTEACFIEIERAIDFSEKARKCGLLILEEELENLDNEKSDILKMGLRLTVEGTDRDIIDKILSNIVNREKNKYLFLLKTIQKETVLMIQEGINTSIIVLVLNSYTDIPFNDPRFKKFLEDHSLLYKEST